MEYHFSERISFNIEGSPLSLSIITSENRVLKVVKNLSYLSDLNGYQLTS
jgi:hypothetical protein